MKLTRMIDIPRHLPLALIFLSIFVEGPGECKASADTHAIRSENPQDPIAGFWKWFAGNESRLRKFESDPGKYLNELHREAKKIKPGLAIELEPPQDGIINLTISADGDKNLFDMVQSVIDKAPAIKGWRFFAFRQRMSAENLKSVALKADGLELNPGKMQFFPIINGDFIDIIIYVKGVTEDNYNKVAYAGLLLLDNILGEYDCVMKVRSYDFQELPVKKEELDQLKPLLELAKFVDDFHAAKNK